MKQSREEKTYIQKTILILTKKTFIDGSNKKLAMGMPLQRIGFLQWTNT